jgi:hypothetical protein
MSLRQNNMAHYNFFYAKAPQRIFDLETSMPESCNLPSVDTSYWFGNLKITTTGYQQVQ